MHLPPRRLPALLALALLLFLAACSGGGPTDQRPSPITSDPPSGNYDIVLVFQEGAFTAQQRAMIQAAAERWEELVVGDIPDNGDMPASIRRECLAIIGRPLGASPGNSERWT